MGALTARTQRDVEIDRAIAKRCPKCGSKRTEPGGLLIVDGEPKEVGVHCRACGFWKDATGIVHHRLYHPPGTEGAHDVEADYRETGND